MLVDDDTSTSRFHEIVIKSLQIIDKITFAKNGKDALDYLLQKGSYQNKQDDFIQPKIIFIDLNMPVMDGFRFVELYTKTEEFLKHSPKIIVLSTTLIPEEKERIAKDENIYQFLNKPLTKPIISNLVSTIIG
jgi:CheY-like chemotaxis protein